MDVYKWLGVRRVVNAEETNSFIGGSIMPPDVVEAWANASRSFVHLDELQAKVSETIARLTGAEAGLITAGADAGLTLATCAAMAGADPEQYQRLPDTGGLKNEVNLPKISTNPHNNAFRVSGPSSCTWATTMASRNTISTQRQTRTRLRWPSCTSQMRSGARSP